MHVHARRGSSQGRVARVAVALPVALAAFGLVAGGCGGKKNGAGGGRQVKIALTPQGCRPKPAKISAGRVTFRVDNVNASKVSEAELHQSNMIVGEKENLTPGLSGKFSLRLKAGKYTIYCPNAKKNTWPFQVTGSAASSTLSPRVAADLKKATSGYHDYVLGEVNELVAHTKTFTAAVKDGDVAKAKNLYAPTRYYYEEVEPVAESFGNLDPEIDARINDVSNTSSWTGFHRIEKALWRDKSLKGMDGQANELNRNVGRLKRHVATARYQPAQLANGATDLLNEVASSKITGEEDRYSRTDLSDFEANIVGGRKAFELLKPALRVIDPKLASTVERQYKIVLAGLKPYAGHYAGTHFVDYSTVPQAERRTLTQKVDALAEPLSKVAQQVNR